MASAELIQKRGRVIAALTKLNTFAESITNEITAEEIEVRLSKIEDYYKEFFTLDNKLSLFPDQTTKADEFEPKFFKVKAIFVREFRKRMPAPSTVAGTENGADLLNRTIDNLCAQQRNFFEGLREHSISQTCQDVRLPRVSIEPFSGNYSHWPSFRDLYKASVHSNEALSDSHKFQLLKGFLRGQAADLIRHIPITDLNYEEAWDKLSIRYEKKKSVVNSLIDKFISQKSMNEFRVQDLRKIADVSDGVIRELKCLGGNCEKRDPWLIFVTLNKLDLKTKEAWAEYSIDMDCPSFEEFLKFINRRCDAYESCSSVKTSVPRFVPASKIPMRFNATHHLTTDNPNCPCCLKGTHPLYKCFKFHKLSTSKRIQLVNDAKICQNCLKSQHSFDECQSRFLCKLCGQSHNILLHDKSSINKDPKNPAIFNATNLNPSYIETSVNTIENFPNKVSSINGLPNNVPSINAPPINDSPINAASINIPPCKSVQHSTVDHQSAVPVTLRNGIHFESSKSQAFLVQHPSLTLLPTALISVKDSRGIYKQFRALLDSGAQSSLISEKCVQSLNLPRSHACLSIKGLSSVVAGQTKGQVDLSILSNTNATLAVRAFVLSKLTSKLPQVPVDLSKFTELKSMKLADTFLDRPGAVDILLGSDIFFQVLRSDSIKLDHYLFAQDTCFGYVIAGKVSTESNDIVSDYSMVNHHVEIHDVLQKFWEVEDIGFPGTNFDCFSETHYKQNTFKDKASNKYVVKLPIKPSSPKLGNSLPMALKRMYAMEKRFSKFPSLKEEYVRFMREYISMEHMSPIPLFQLNRDPSHVFYFPRHAVFKESSSTTKVRVVFDGSSKSLSGVSLNDILDPGPSILQELFDVLVRFRKHKIGFAADVEKMFRMVIMNEKNRDLQRIVWRESPDQPIGHYRLNTVTYGTASATFLAVRTLHQIADDLPSSLSPVKDIIKSDFYVDDLLSGAETVQIAKDIRKKIVQALLTGGFRLRKWVSNSSEFLSSVPQDDRESLVEFDDGNLYAKTLGLIWVTQSDSFTFKVHQNSDDDYSTKRKLLSTTASIFDPLGFLAPCTIAAKILFQGLWLHKLDWDDPLPHHLNSEWQKLRSNFALFDRVQIPRFLGIPSNPQKLELHGFSDSSEKAYSATVYLRTVDVKGVPTVSLVAAKTKVAPLKKICLPRLELCGAVLLVKLLMKLKSALDIPNIEIYGWTDSTIVLAWLSGEPSRWKTFIANRVSYIITHLPRNNWDHVPSELNPADCASRGITPEKLINHALWWNGPKFLRLSSEDWPTLDSKHVDLSNESNSSALAIQTVIVQENNIKNDTIEFLSKNTSSFSKFILSLAQCLRFIDILKTKTKFLYLTAQHVKNATMIGVKWAQSQSFLEDMKRIKKGDDLSKSSKLKSLNPFIDDQDILRVGGRIGLTTCLSNEVKHPAILDKEHDFTQRLVNHLHLRHLHPTHQQLLAIIRQSYWIIGAKQVVKKVSRLCITCILYRHSISQQQMGNLPYYRVTPSRPFSNVGVDFAGPVRVKSKTGRGGVITKGYIAVFVCQAVKAVHVELVSNLTTEAFIACLRRFISRRGLPSCLYSDNGSNFVGTRRKINQLFDACSTVSEGEVRDFLVQQRIDWHFIPPSTPHLSGMWEAGVKSVKRHLVRTIGETSLTFEEYSTMLAQIECLLNSRPLAPMDISFSENFELLTPGHFIMGCSPLMLPDPPIHVDDEPRSITNRWQLLQNLMRGFWRLWKNDYLTSLQQRHKWQKKSPSYRVNDFVLLKDVNSPPGFWAKGIITETHPGKDGLVRVVTIRTTKGTYKRSINNPVPYLS